MNIEMTKSELEEIIDSVGWAVKYWHKELIQSVENNDRARAAASEIIAVKQTILLYKLKLIMKEKGE